MESKAFLIARLIAKTLIGNATDEERQKLEEWQKLSSGNRALYHKIHQKENIREAGRQLKKYNKEEGWEKISAGCRQTPASPRLPRQSKRLQVGKYAAILLIAVGGWYLLYKASPVPPEPQQHTVATSVPRQEPGIYLTLPDGTSINLKDSVREIPIAGTGLTASNDGTKISFKNLPHNDSLRGTINEISVAKGEIYQLELSDGSLLLLNSLSKVKFPAVFSGAKREIRLEGEAYLTVARDEAHPFIVRTGTFEIKVLGTQFNVSAYPEDRRLTTTLVEGAVSVVNPEYQLDTQLRPRQQLRIDKINRRTTVETVDISSAIAWTKGRLRFKDIRLEELMTILERWYDIEVEYAHPGVRELVFGCNFTRQNTIDEMINIFESTGKITIKRSGKHLIIQENP